VLENTKCVSLDWFSTAWVRIAAGFHLRTTAGPCTCTITSCPGILDFTGCASRWKLGSLAPPALTQTIRHGTDRRHRCIREKCSSV